MLTKTELEILEQIAEGKETVRAVARALKKSDKQIYRSAGRLKQKGFLKESLQPKESPQINLLLNLLSQFPNLIPLLSRTGIPILTSLLEPRTIEEIMELTKTKKSLVYQKLKTALRISVVKKEKNQYSLNEKLWKNLREFLVEYKNYEELVDPRVPADSVIYYKTEEEIVFSSRKKLPATKTAFSAYRDYGIKILLPTNYYYLPPKKLSLRKIYLHSLYVAEKERTHRHLTYLAIFYLKFKPQVKHPLSEKIKLILKGEKIEGFPSQQEIKEKAEVYQ